MTTEEKFFIPKARDDAQAQEVWQVVKKFAEKNLEWMSQIDVFSVLLITSMAMIIMWRLGNQIHVTENLLLQYLSQSSILCVRQIAVCYGVCQFW